MLQLVIAIGMLVVPFVAGLLSWHALRALPQGRKRVLATASVVVVTALPFLVPVLRPGPLVLGFWDMLTLSGLYVVGLAMAPASARPRFAAKLAVSVASLAVSLCVAEGALRAVLAPFPMDKLRRPSEQTLLLPGVAEDGTPYVATSLGWNNRACSSVFAHDFPRQRRRVLDEVAPKAAHVLHVGDSMVETSGPEPNAFRVTEWLNQQMPDVAHINVGNSDTGPDAYLSSIRAWRRLARIDLVVVYFFPGNDVTDVDRPFACCGQGSLLRYDGGGGFAGLPSDLHHFATAESGSGPIVARRRSIHAASSAMPSRR